MIRRTQTAKIIRAVTVPPVMVLVLLLILFFHDAGVFSSPQELLLSILLLSLLPLMGYPLSYLLPKYKSRGREGQRNLALILSLGCYSGALLYGLLTKVSRNLFLIFSLYFLSVSVLILFNKVIGIRASGHACSLTGPMLLFIYFFGSISILPCVLLFGAILWASLTLKRHTLKELGFGALSAAIAFVLSLLPPAWY